MGCVSTNYQYMFNQSKHVTSFKILKNLFTIYFLSQTFSIVQA